MILETIPAIGSLTVDQKLRLVCELWQDVSHDTSLPSSTASVLDERIAEYNVHPESTRTTDEVTAGIMRLKRRIADSRS